MWPVKVKSKKQVEDRRATAVACKLNRVACLKTCACAKLVELPYKLLNNPGC